MCANLQCNVSEIAIVGVSTAAQLWCWFKWGNRLAQHILFLQLFFCFKGTIPYRVKCLKIPFCMAFWPADQTTVLLKRQQASSCCSALQATIQLQQWIKWQGCFLMPKQQQNHHKQSKILFALCLGCQLIQNTWKLHVYMTNSMEIVLQVCSGKHGATAENLNKRSEVVL